MKSFPFLTLHLHFAYPFVLKKSGHPKHYHAKHRVMAKGQGVYWHWAFVSHLLFPSLTNEFVSVYISQPSVFSYFCSIPAAVRTFLGINLWAVVFNTQCV